MPSAESIPELEHRAGRWDFLHEVQEVARYGIVAAYVHHYLREGGSVLDVGCGEALLYPYLDPRRVGRYVGLDASATALARAGVDASRADLVCALLEEYAAPPERRFDAILFNEVLGFAQQPLAQIERYRYFLAEDGVLILSLYQTPRESSGARALTRAIWELLDRDWTVLDETMLVNVGRDLCWRLRVAR